MKMFKVKHILIVAMIIVSFSGYAQQDPLFTQYMNNPGLINPAYAGSKGVANINGIFRKQWIGQEWSPSTTSLSVNSPFFKYNIGLGVTFIDDQIGPSHQVGLYADYAKYFTFTGGKNISLGLKAGFNSYDISLANLVMHQPDPYIAADPHKKAFLPNFGLGVFYFANDYYVGLSIPKILRNSIKDSENTLETLGKEERHIYLTAGYLFVIAKPVVKFKASMMSRFVNGAPASLELTGTAIVYDRVWFGLTYRLGDAIAAHARVEISDRLQLGYSFDLNNSRLRGYNSGSHEIFISYDFSFKGQKILSPRYFL
jgi:type IX secretion system PorP/SprF family membrane protein